MLILGKTTENVLVVEQIQRNQKHSSIVHSETWGKLDVLCDLSGAFNLGIVGQLTESYIDPIRWAFVPKQYRFAYLSQGQWYLTNKLPEYVDGRWIHPEGARVEAIDLSTGDSIPESKSLFRRPKAVGEQV